MPLLDPTTIPAMIAEFHSTLGNVSDPPRQTLHEEEHRELIEALDNCDRLEIARELADVVYVAYGTARIYGIDLDAAVAEVHASNMTKFDGATFREDGKILKGPNFRPPDLSGALL